MTTKKIEQLMDNVNEQIEIYNDINDLLSAPLSTNDFDLESELNNLNNEIIAENMIQINLPKTPSDSIELPNEPEISSNDEINKQLEGLEPLTTGK